MTKNLTLALVSGSLIIYVFMNNSEMLNTLPWDTSAPFKNNIAPYIALFLCVASPYAVISTLFGLNEGNKKTAEQTERAIGEIISMEYSGYRINNSPMFKVNIAYNEVTKIFDPIPEKVQFNLKQGDKAVINYNPENIQDSYFDLDETINLKK